MVGIAPNNIDPQWLATGAAWAGVIYAIIRNGSRRKAQDEKLKQELLKSVESSKKDIASIIETLNNPDTGLTAIKACTQDMQLHCAKTSTKIMGQVKTNTKEIETLRRRAEGGMVSDG